MVQKVHMQILNRCLEGLSILGPLLKTKYHSLSILISTCFFHRFSLISVLSFSQLSSTFEITQRTVIKIDCGIDSPTPISDSTRWLPDQFYTGGVTALISSNTTSDTHLLPMTSIRHFPFIIWKEKLLLIFFTVQPISYRPVFCIRKL